MLKLKELNRLIICRYGENGTEMIRLTEEEIGHFEKAQSEGLDFSDYWVDLGIQAEHIE